MRVPVAGRILSHEQSKRTCARASNYTHIKYHTDIGVLGADQWFREAFKPQDLRSEHEYHFESDKRIGSSAVE